MDENGGKSTTTYEFNKKPKAPTGGSTFKRFLWNPDTKEFFGRTGGSWFKITVFYLIFYFFLACFFLFCYYLFSLTLSDEKPKWTGSANIIGTNPGIGFRPMPDPEENEMSSLVWINQHQDAYNSTWSTQLDNFFAKKYSQKIDRTCSFENGKVADEESACEVDVSNLEVCNKDTQNYGYTQASGRPCVLIKLNKIFDWKPEPYLVEDLETAKERGMPQNLLDQIKTLGEQTDETSLRKLNTVWVSCEGENPHDREFIKSEELEYYAPGNGKFQGIPNYYFPFTMQKPTYESPFVFVRFPKLPQGVLIQMECKAWAKNIIPDRLQRLGSVHFELLYT